MEGAFRDLHVELVEIDVAEDQIPQFLLQEGLTKPLDEVVPGEAPGETHGSSLPPRSRSRVSSDQRWRSPIETTKLEAQAMRRRRRMRRRKHACQDRKVSDEAPHERRFHLLSPFRCYYIFIHEESGNGGGGAEFKVFGELGAKEGFTSIGTCVTRASGIGCAWSVADMCTQSE